MVADLKGDLEGIRRDIDDAQKQDQRYTGGLIKSRIAVRLELLKTNAALVEQRIHTIEGGTRTTVVVNVVKTDPSRAAELAKEIETQKEKVSAARAQADRYAGGLALALSETTFATAGNTLAMLEQQYLAAKYGLSIPASTEGSGDGKATPKGISPSVSSPATSGAATTNCLKIQTFDSSVLSTNNVYTELAWKVDVANSCDMSFRVRATFTIFDKDDFELDSGSEDVNVPANGVGNARGKMLVSPPEKARRMTKQGASLSMR